MGTPHLGSDKATWGKMATKLANLVLKDNNDRIIKTLEIGSDVAEHLREEFEGIVMDLELRTCLEELGYGKAGKARLPHPSSQGHII